MSKIKTVNVLKTENHFYTCQYCNWQGQEPDSVILSVGEADSEITPACPHCGEVDLVQKLDSGITKSDAEQRARFDALDDYSNDAYRETASKGFVYAGEYARVMLIMQS